TVLGMIVQKTECSPSKICDNARPTALSIGDRPSNQSCPPHMRQTAGTRAEPCASTLKVTPDEELFQSLYFVGRDLSGKASARAHKCLVPPPSKCNPGEPS